MSIDAGAGAGALDATVVTTDGPAAVADPNPEESAQREAAAANAELAGMTAKAAQAEQDLADAQTALAAAQARVAAADGTGQETE